MSKIEQFMEHLKADNIVEALQIVKEELSERSRSLVTEMNLSTAEKYNMTRIAEEKEEENETEEEKEARRAKEEEEKSSKE